jgi:molybdopterin converting factor small subunit
MTVRVLYFSSAADLAGVQQETLDLGGPCTLEQLRARIAQRHPALSPLLAGLLWSIDETVAGPHEQVRPGQTVAVMPPFSGG